MQAGDQASVELPPKRVLHVITRYLSGGSERRLRDAVVASPELSHFIVVGSEHDEVRLASDLPGVPFEVLPTLVRQPKPLLDASAYRALHGLLRRYEPDLVQTHQSKAGVLARFAASRRKIPTLHSLSGANFGPSFGRVPSILFKFLESSLGRRTAAYAVVGVDLRNRFERLGITPHKLRVIRSSIDIDFFRAAPPRDEAAKLLGISAGQPTVAYIGRFERGKGVEDLPSLMAAVNQLHPGVSLVLAGDGPLRGEISSRCAELAKGDFVDLGFTPRVDQVIAAADVIVLLSRAEGLPQVLVQALAVGRSFVTFAVDGAAELSELSGGACEVVPIGDVDGAARAVSRVLRERLPIPAANLDEWQPEAVHAAYRSIYAELLTAEAD